jgi:hypothetical protein
MQPTEAQREAAFMRYVELSEPYFEVVEANGDKPWFESIDERRDLFMRRYIRPAPPVGLSIPLIGSVRQR